MAAPWTRDGTVRADVVKVAPDVSGLVSEVLVLDNQDVRKGQVLFRIDPVRFQYALQEATAKVTAKESAAQEAAREMNRFRALTSLEVSTQEQQQSSAKAVEAAAAYQQAVVDRNVAQLNLDRSEVRASVDGTVTNFSMRPGDYVTAGAPIFALIDTDSIYVAGYFEETKLPADPGRRSRAGAPDGRKPAHRGPCAEHCRRRRRPRTPGQQRSAGEHRPDFQLGAPGAARAGADRTGSRPARCAPACGPHRERRGAGGPAAHRSSAAGRRKALIRMAGEPESDS